MTKPEVDPVIDALPESDLVVLINNASDDLCRANRILNGIYLAGGGIGGEDGETISTLAHEVEERLSRASKNCKTAAFIAKRQKGEAA